MDQSPARKIVVLVCRAPSRERDIDLLCAIAASPDWDEVVALAEAHGVLSLLADVFGQARWAKHAPAEIRHRLKLTLAAQTLQVRAGLSQLERVVSRLQQQQVPVLVLKGPALASRVYPAAPYRLFTDLDLLCPPDSHPQADTVLRACGYAPLVQKATEQEGFHVVYTAPGTLLPIELHSDLLQLGLPTRCAADLWRAPESFAVGATRIPMLGVDYQVLHLCVHLHTHGYSRLIWFKDLDLLLRSRSAEIDWDHVYALARGEGAVLSVHRCLLLLRDLLHTPVPPEALDGRVSLANVRAIHAWLWPCRAVQNLQGRQQLRSVRFNPRLGVMGVLPSLLVMGRRRDKLARLLRAPARRQPEQAAGERLSGTDPGPSESAPSAPEAVLGARR